MSLYNKLFSEELMHEFIIVIARNFIGHWRLIEFFFFLKARFYMNFPLPGHFHHYYTGILYSNLLGLIK